MMKRSFGLLMVMELVIGTTGFEGPDGPAGIQGEQC